MTMKYNTDIQKDYNFYTDKALRKRSFKQKFDAFLTGVLWVWIILILILMIINIFHL